MLSDSSLSVTIGELNDCGIRPRFIAGIVLTSYLVPFRSYRSLLLKFGHFVFLSHLLGGGGLRSTYDVPLNFLSSLESALWTFY